MQVIFILIAVGAGIASALQSGTNQALQKALAAPLWSIAVIAGITAATSIALVSLSGEKPPTAVALAGAPWWSWIGGLLGVCFVLSTVYASPRLGAGLFMASIVTAELIAGLMVDHFGLLGFGVHQAGWGRLAGAALMIVGMALIAAF